MSDSDYLRFVIENGKVTAAYELDGDFEGPDYEHLYKLDGERVIEQEYEGPNTYEIKYYDPTDEDGLYIKVESFYVTEPIIISDLSSSDNSFDDDKYYGSSDDDEYHGFGGDDRIYGEDGDDDLYGDDGDDYLSGGDSDDYLDGGEGLDFALFLSSLDQYDIVILEDGSVQVQDTVGTEGLDSLFNIERIEFSDTNLALDIDGNAGAAAKLLGVTFGAESVENEVLVGIAIGLLDNGMNYQTLMELALQEKEALTNKKVAELLYVNIFGEADDDVIENLAALMNNGAITQTALAVYAAELEENELNIDLVGLALTGIEYTPFI